MKKIIGILAISTMLYSCDSTKKEVKNEPFATTDTAIAKPAVVGNEADEHGCKASAGYTWSVVKNDCIRVWETGEQLSPIKNTSNSIFKAFLVFSDDKNKAELFIFGESKNVLLDKKLDKADAFANSVYEVQKVGAKWILKKKWYRYL